MNLYSASLITNTKNWVGPALFEINTEKEAPHQRVLGWLTLKKLLRQVYLGSL